MPQEIFFKIFGATAEVFTEISRRRPREVKNTWNGRRLVHTVTSPCCSPGAPFCHFRF